MQNVINEAGVCQYTVTASLVAARLEEDNTIDLLIANPADPSVTVRVSFPHVTPAAPIKGRARSARMQAARRSFVESITLPSFEGFALLYGEARLTITGAGGPRDCEEAAGQRARLLVLDFVPLDGAVPHAGICPKSALSDLQSADLSGAESWLS